MNFCPRISFSIEILISFCINNINSLINSWPFDARPINKNKENKNGN